MEEKVRCVVSGCIRQSKNLSNRAGFAIERTCRYAKTNFCPYPRKKRKRKKPDNPVLTEDVVSIVNG